MKTHMTANIVEKAVKSGKVKVIVTVRNPKDTLVSMYHFYRMCCGLGNFTGTWDEFFELYKTKHVVSGDYFDWYESWMSLIARDNVQLYKYEDMKEDLESEIIRLAKFLGKEITKDQVGAIVNHTTFKSMKDNAMVNNEHDVGLKSEISSFIRKGEVGDWKNYFSPAQSQYVEEEYTSKLKKLGLELRFQ